MQEEVENRTLTLVVSGTKFTGRLFKAAIAGSFCLLCSLFDFGGSWRS